MIATSEMTAIKECAKKYHADEVYLFGSSLDSDEYRDIDIAVSGLAPELFFKFYGELFRKVSKPIDVIDLSGKSSFNGLVLKAGKKIYG